MRRFHLWLPALALLLCGAPVRAEEGGERGYYRQPAYHHTKVVFVAEGDLWSAPWFGGTATRLTTHPDMELHPAISPDGNRIAFSGRYEGPTEVYVMPIEGGRPTRLTYGAGRPRVVGWKGDGSVLYSSRRYSGLPEPPPRSRCIDVTTGAELRRAPGPGRRRRLRSGRHPVLHPPPLPGQPLPSATRVAASSSSGAGPARTVPRPSRSPPITRGRRRTRWSSTTWASCTGSTSSPTATAR